MISCICVIDLRLVALVEHGNCGLLITLGDFHHLAGLELVGSLSITWWLCRGLDRVLVRGFEICPTGDSPKATLVECSWLVGVFFVIDSCGTKVVALA